MKYDNYGRPKRPEPVADLDKNEMLRYALAHPKILRNTINHRLEKGEITQKNF